jgi:hypothetical protein
MNACRKTRSNCPHTFLCWQFQLQYCLHNSVEMSKLRLDFEPDFDFRMLCISSPEKDYRFCWGLNLALGIQLERVKSILADSKTLKKDEFPVFQFEDPETQLHYRLICNKFAGAIFLRELEEFHYILIIKGELDGNAWQKIIDQVQSSGMAFFVEQTHPAKLKNKNYLLY